MKFKISQKQMCTIAATIHFFVAFGAIAGGAAAILNPNSPMGITTEALKMGPFDDFMLPGLFLAVVLGVFNLIVGIGFVKMGQHAGKGLFYFSGFEACALMGWILAQCWILQGFSPLHVIYFCIGGIQGVLALILLINADHQLEE